MKFKTSLLEGRLIRRYKRFMADIELSSGEIITAHSTNSGSMKGVCTPDSEVWVSRADNPSRKLKYTWELIKVGDKLVGINTNHPNLLAYESLSDGSLKEFSGYTEVRREVKYGKNSRIDILLSDGEGSKHYIEVKNVTLSRVDGVGEFPDAVTSRGAKHLDELKDMVQQGHKATMLYIVQRQDCENFRIASDIDKYYAIKLEEAISCGVDVVAYDCLINTFGLELNKRLSFSC